MTARNRTYKVTFGGTQIGGDSTSYWIDGEPVISHTYTRGRVSFTAIVSGTSAADFTTKSQALEALFRLPHQVLVVTLGSSDQTFSEASNTALNITPSIGLSRSAVATDRSRSYDCAIDFELPADRTGDSGLRDSDYRVSVGPNGQRIITITGQYSALGAKKAYTQYKDSIEAYETTIKTAIDPAVEWDLLERDGTPDKENANCDFKSVIEEVIYQQGVGVPNVAAIKTPRLEATPTIVYDGLAIPGLRRPIVVDVSYEANVDKASTTDLTTLYTATIRPLMLAYAEASMSVAGSTGLSIIQAEVPAFAPTANTVRASIRLLVPDGGVFAADIQDEISIGPSFRLIPVVSRKAYAKIGMPAFAQATRKITASVTILGGRLDAYNKALEIAKIFEKLTQDVPGALPDFADRYSSIPLDALPEPALSAGGKWIFLGPTPVFSGPTYVGETGLAVTTCVLVMVYEFAEEPGEPRPITGSDGGTRFTTEGGGAVDRF